MRHLGCWSILLMLSEALSVQSADASQSVPPASEPTFSPQTRRRLNNCDQDWMRNIEAQAWADAGAMANIASQWTPQGKWQDAMDYFMGKDSVTDDVKYKISSNLDNEKKAHQPNAIFPEAVIDIYCGSHPIRNICYLRTNPRDPNGPKVTAFASAWVSRGYFWNKYNIVLCPRFFEEKQSLWGLVNDTEHGRIDKSNATNYKFTWGHTLYHELLHLDPVVANKQTLDIEYGACDVATLAEYNGCTGEKKVSTWKYSKPKPNSMANADSWAMFASAAYFQDTLKLDAPGTVPDCDTSRDLSAPDTEHTTFFQKIFDPLVVEGTLEPSDWMDAALVNTSSPPEPRADQIPASDGPIPVMPIDTASPPAGLATPYVGAVSYFANLEEASKINSSTASSSTTAAPSQTSACVDNQINGPCTQASYPSLAPNSGVQSPVCNKVDDPQNNLVRINATQAQQAAVDYCSKLASDKVILGVGSQGPNPAIINGAAENNKQLALSVQYDASGCPADGSLAAIDFTQMSADECKLNFYTQTAEFCEQDSTWPNYDSQFTIEGGVFLNDCGLWSMSGQP